MIASILPGPSFLGRIAPAALAYLFPVESLGALNVLSQIGLILFLFLVGLQIRPHRNPGVAGAAIAASSASIFTPLVLGALLSVPLHHWLASSVPLPAFALFIGAAMSITAFPVLARILSERGMLNSRAGVISRGIPNYPGEVNVAAAGSHRLDRKTLSTRAVARRCESRTRLTSGPEQPSVGVGTRAEERRRPADKQDDICTPKTTVLWPSRP